MMPRAVPYPAVARLPVFIITIIAIIIIATQHAQLKPRCCSMTKHAESHDLS
jgi:hypothetical protein